VWIGQKKSFKYRNNAADASQFGSVGSLIIRVSWDLIDSVNSALISGSLERSECRDTDAEVVRAITAGYGSS